MTWKQIGETPTSATTASRCSANSIAGRGSDMKFYHHTDSKYLPSIFEKGLLARPCFFSAIFQRNLENEDHSDNV